MIRDLKHHRNHYLALVLLLGLHSIAFVILSYNHAWQRLLLISACVVYFVWGVLHHYFNHDLENHIIIEYVLFATLGYILGSMMIQ